MTKLEMINEILQNMNFANPMGRADVVANLMKNNKGRVEEVYNVFKNDKQGIEHGDFYMGVLIVW